jgi:hypothetical protein
VKFFLVAMLFIVFDIETIFLPVGRVLQDARHLRVFEMLVFIGTVGVVYAMCGGAAVWIGTDRWVSKKVPSGVLLTSVEKLVNWSRKSSFWPATFTWPVARSR